MNEIEERVANLRKLAEKVKLPLSRKLEQMNDRDNSFPLRLRNLAAQYEDIADYVVAAANLAPELADALEEMTRRYNLLLGAIDDQNLLDAAKRELAGARKALRTAEAFIVIMFSSGPDAILPETIPTPVGPPVKIGEIVGDIRAALAPAPADGKAEQERK